MRARDALVALAVAMAMLAGMELILRLLYRAPGSQISLRQVNEIAFQAHPDYLVTVRPNLQRRPFVRRTANGEVVTHWSTNSDSFRGPEIGSRTGRRIIVYGDSNIFARFSDEEHTFVQQLARRLEALTGQPTEVLNAGVPGFGPDQSLLRFRGEVGRYQPDLVVFHVFADNDFGDLVRNRIFMLSAGGEVVMRPGPRATDPCLSGGACTPIPVGLRQELREWASSLYVTRAGRKALAVAGIEIGTAGPTAAEEIGYYLAASETEYRLFLDPADSPVAAFADHYDFDLALQPDSQSARLKRQLIRAVLAAARDEAARHGVGLLLLIQPSSRDLTTNLSPNFTHFAKFPGYRPTNLSGAVAGIGASLDIDVADLFATYAASQPERLYFTDGDTHWNDAGQALAADVVARHIAARGTLGR